ncbi:hypothetical protein Bhyg_07529, partial [Pseudolycoriella hygida]
VTMINTSFVDIVENKGQRKKLAPILTITIPYDEDYSISHRCNHHFSNLFVQMVHKKFAAFAILSLTTFLILIIYTNIERDHRAQHL